MFGKVVLSIVGSVLAVTCINFPYIVQPRLSEHVGTRQNVRMIESSDNRGCLYINAIMPGQRRSVGIIECSDNRSSDNRGFTVCASNNQLIIQSVYFQNN